MPELKVEIEHTIGIPGLGGQTVRLGTTAIVDTEEEARDVGRDLFAHASAVAEGFTEAAEAGAADAE